MSRVLLLAAVLLLSPGVTVVAEEPVQAEELQPAETEPLVEPAEMEPVEETDPPREEEPDAESEETVTRRLPVSDDPCEVRAAGDEERLDRFRREVYESVCEAAQWFDGFFGSRRFDEEARQTHGRLGVQVVWDEYDGFDLDGRLKVRVDFPNLDRRVNAFLGREDEQAFLTGSEERLDFLPTFFQREGGEEWLLGLGYRPVGNDRSALDFDGGIHIATPVDPFVRARYRYVWLIGDDNLLRARQTVYWTNQRDVGSGTRVDFERPVGTRSLVRWSGNMVFDGQTRGADWDSGVTLFHGFSDDRAISFFAGIDGETDRAVPIENYGTRITYRQRMLREWFFGELITGVTWPRQHLHEQRERSWHFGFGAEIYFSRD
jgi:hypothetical protein